MRTKVVFVLFPLVLSLGAIIPTAVAVEDVPRETTTTVSTTIALDPGEDQTEGVGNVPWWLLILVSVALITIVVALTRGGSKPSPVIQPVTWKDLARESFANTRWLSDALTEELALWRGNPPVGDAGSAVASTWSQVANRMETAKSNLYALEASAPDTNTAARARTTVDALIALRSAVDERAAARANYRAVESDPNADTASMINARDREIRATSSLYRARASLAEALNGLATVR
jgi:hypothetical protein